MTDTYASVQDLTARLSATYAVPVNAAQLLEKASELIDYATLGRAQAAWASGKVPVKAAITKATCDQVEYWLEVGEEQDVVGLQGALQGGRVQIQHLPGYLGKRALRGLLAAGLYYAGVPSV